MFDLIKSIYRKEPMKVDELDLGICIALTSTLKNDPDNLPILKKLLQVLYYIDPKNYVILLFLSIPRKFSVPFLKGVKKLDKPENVLYNKIQSVLGWSKRELKFHEPILDKIIDKDYWGKELAVKWKTKE
jgi:hypothetical protein